jgi:hypothetical protein
MRDGQDEVLERAVHELLGPSADAKANRRIAFARTTDTPM